MALTFDATLKDLARDNCRDFVAMLDKPTSQAISLLNIDLSAITTSADFVVGLGDPLEEVVHFEFQSSANAEKHLDILVYNALLHKFYRVPVHSALVLLRPQADHSNITGNLNYSARPPSSKMEFGYDVVKLWNIPASNQLKGNLGTIPLAPLGQLPSGLTLENGLADVIHQLINRVVSEAPPERTRELLTASFLLTGLRIDRSLAKKLYHGVSAMYESSTFMAIMEEGEEKGQRKALKSSIRIIGVDRLGPPNKEIMEKLEAISDLGQLEQLVRKSARVQSWEELFDD